MTNNRNQCGLQKIFKTLEEQERFINLVRKFGLKLNKCNYFKHWYKSSFKDWIPYWLYDFYTAIRRKKGAPLYPAKYFIMHLVESRIHHSELSYYVVSLLISLHFMLVVQAVPTPRFLTTVPITN